MNISRRDSLSLALSGIASIAAAKPASAQERDSAPLFAITTGPYLQSPAEHSMAVMWITNRNATGAVEFGTLGGGLQKVVNSHDGLIDCNTRIHKVVLGDLQPGTAYRYRLVSQEIRKFGAYKMEFGDSVATGFRQFRTVDRTSQKVSFLVFNDMHEIASTFGDMLKVAGPEPYDFVLLNGDTISEVTQEGQITNMLNAAAATFAGTVPLIWVRGNHETRGQLARQFPSYIDLPNGRYYYSFHQGPAHFVVLDTGEDKADSDVEYSGLTDFKSYRREQAAWLRAEVATAAFRSAKFRVVFCHMPFPSTAPGQEANRFTGQQDAFDAFGAILNGAGVDMMISAHLHSAAILKPEAGRHNYPILRGGGPKDPGRTVIRVNVDETELLGEIIRADGSLYGTCRVPAKG